MAETDNETKLEIPIKFGWTGKARMKIYGHNLDFDSEKSDCVARTLDRQKTNVVIKTVEEAHALANEMDRYRDDGGSYGRVWVNGAIAKACDRVRSEVISGMKGLGYVADATGRGVTFSEPDEDAVTPGDVVEQTRELIAEHGAAEITDRGMSWTVTDPTGVRVMGDAVGVDGGAFSPGEHTEVSPSEVE